MKGRFPINLARLAALTLLFGIVLALGAGGTAWAREDRERDHRTGRPGSTVPRRLADLSITKTGRWSRDDVTFTIRVKNSGPAVARDVVVTDYITSELNYRSVDTSQGRCSYKRSILICNLGEIKVNKEVRIEVRTSVKSRWTRRVSNTAIVASPTEDPSYRNNLATTTVKR